MKLCLFALIVLATTGVASAADCAHATSQRQMEECAGLALQKADGQLNAVYKQIVNRLKNDKPATALLVAAETAWIHFRDAECAFSSSASAGGTIYPMVVDGCLERLTLVRVKELTAYTKCSEYDSSCPVPK